MLYPLALLIPLFLLLIFLEWKFDENRNGNNFEISNISNNMSIGAVDQFSSFGYLFILYACLNFVHSKFAILVWDIKWTQWVCAFIAVDFTSYWYHRFSHKINLLWAGHITHHSSSYFNFSNGFRTSPFQGLFRIFFWLWMPILGFEPIVLVLCFQISGLHDFLVHTTIIKKLGWLEKFIVTPSHHRVHHGKNDIYLDKNFGSFFILWDKLFGTFQEETEPVVYGVKSEFVENNPVNSIFYHFKYLAATWVNIPNYSNKLKLLFMPPGWIPESSEHGKVCQQTNKPPLISRCLSFFLLAVGTLGTIVFLYLGKTLNPWYFALGIAFTLTSLYLATIILKKIQGDF